MNIMMSETEINNLMNLSRKLREEGKEDEATEVAMKIPLAPHLAMAAKEVFGAEYIKNAGFNLIKAEAEYGKDWMER